jgi:hypothetical protein
VGASLIGMGSGWVLSSSHKASKLAYTRGWHGLGRWVIDRQLTVAAIDDVAAFRKLARWGFKLRLDNDRDMQPASQDKNERMMSNFGAKLRAARRAPAPDPGKASQQGDEREEKFQEGKEIKARGKWRQPIAVAASKSSYQQESGPGKGGKCLRCCPKLAGQGWLASAPCGGSVALGLDCCCVLRSEKCVASSRSPDQCSRRQLWQVPKNQLELVLKAMLVSHESRDTIW